MKRSSTRAEPTPLSPGASYRRGVTGDSPGSDGRGGADGTTGSWEGALGPSGPRARFVAALAVRRNAAAGLAAGVAVAAAVYWVFVATPSETRFSPLLYAVLSLTVALATATVVALALTLVRAVRLWRRLEDVEG